MTSEKQKAWAIANRDHLKEYRARYYAQNKERLKVSNRTYRLKNSETLNAARNKRVRDRLRQEPQFKLRYAIRNRLFCALKRKDRSVHTLALLGCSVDFLKKHLEDQFQSGMTWENHGPVWHVDHVKPCAKFCLEDPEQLEECFHYTNLQPLFALDNLRKSDKY